ncbi:MAG: hypothetical protein AAGF23_16000, partial [Acidobacteriota bacterium]
MARILRNRSSRLALGLAVGLLAVPAQALEIDDFSVGDEPILNSGTYATAASNSLGGAVDFRLERLQGTNGAEVRFSAVNGVTFSVNLGDDAPVEDVDDGALGGTLTRARTTITWDGDLNTSAFNQTGLGGEDLTLDGSAFRLTLAEATAGVEAIIEVYTDGTLASTAYRVLPGGANEILFPFSVFTPLIGAGADFSNVGAIRVILQATEPRLVRLVDFDTVAPSVDVTMTDLRLDDSDLGAATVGPGDQFKYRITVSNTGGDALGLSIEVDPGLDTNTAVSSVQTQPIGIDDNYEGFGNVTLTVPAATGVLSNDADPDGDSPQV